MPPVAIIARIEVRSPISRRHCGKPRKHNMAQANDPFKGDSDEMSTKMLNINATGLSIATSTASATSTANLAVGRYVMAVYATGGLTWCQLGNSATYPTDKADLTTGFFARDGETLEIRTAVKLSVILSGGTGVLGLTRLV